jgi:hypothetical protein
MPKAKTPPQPVVVGVYLDPHALVHAAESARDRGFRGLDAIVPYPIHGISEALNYKPSWMPRITKGFFFAGAAAGFTFEAWSMAVAWPINIAGKPFVSVPAYMPVTFECGILCAGIATFAAVLMAARLRPRPNFVPIDPRFTNDRFALLIPYGEEGSASAQSFLAGTGALEVYEIAS